MVPVGYGVSIGPQKNFARLAGYNVAMDYRGLLILLVVATLASGLWLGIKSIVEQSWPGAVVGLLVLVLAWQIITAAILLGRR